MKPPPQENGGKQRKRRKQAKEVCTWLLRARAVGTVEGAYGSRPRPTCPCSHGRRHSASPGICTRRCGRRTGCWEHRPRAQTWSPGLLGHSARPPRLSHPRSQTGGRRPSDRGCSHCCRHSGTPGARRLGPHSLAHRCHPRNRHRRHTRTQRPGTSGCHTGTRVGHTLCRTESRSAGQLTSSANPAH